MKPLIKRYIGDKAFYKMLISITLPIMIQNGITNFVSLLDNIMVGRLGTEAMSGVSIVNQFIFIFNLIVFGATSGAGIFTAQYYGKGDTEGIRNTFRLKLIINAIASIACIAVFLSFDDLLINLFLTSEDSQGDIALTLEYSKQYLRIMVLGLIPYAITYSYSSTMRETGDTLTPMISSLAAVLTNCVLNLILIFGLLGMPALGVRGAAIATVFSRFVELFVVVIKTHRSTAKFPYIVGAYRSFRIPLELVRKIAAKGLPLMANEFFWSLAITFRNQCYSTRGLEAVAAQNMTLTLYNLVTVVYMALSVSLSIIVGARLGAGEIEVAKDYNRKILTFSVLISLGLAVILCIAAPFYPKIYNTTETVRDLCTYMLAVSAFLMPFNAFAHASYFTLRTGGKIMVTILMDSLFMWVVVAPCSFILANFTALPIQVIYPICQAVEFLKIIIAVILLKRGDWAVKLVEE